MTCYTQVKLSVMTLHHTVDSTSLLTQDREVKCIDNYYTYSNAGCKCYLQFLMKAFSWANTFKMKIRILLTKVWIHFHLDWVIQFRIRKSINYDWYVCLQNIMHKPSLLYTKETMWDRKSVLTRAKSCNFTQLSQHFRQEPSHFTSGPRS